MARAYQVKGSQSETQECPSCGYIVPEMKTKEFLQVSDDNIEFEDDYSHYISATATMPLVTCYYCENCEEWMSSEPSTHEESTWRCGVCEANWASEQEARSCCQ